MQEISLEKVESLSVLNKKYRAWLEEGYQHKPHSGIDNDTPMGHYQKDCKKVSFASPEECYDAFLHEETRKVDKTGCVSLTGINFEAGVSLIGKKVDLRFDPFDLSVVEIWYQGKKSLTVKPLVIGEFCGSAVREKQSTDIGHSRLLKVYEKDYEKRQKRNMTVLSFSKKEGAE
jgi:hypothetical protein